MYLWPFRLLPPYAVRWFPYGNVAVGPVSLDGASQQAVRTDGGGLWGLECSFETPTNDAILALRGWAVHLDAGMTEFVMPRQNLNFAPLPISAGKPVRAGKPPIALDPFGEEGNYGPALITATAAAASLRATSVAITMTQGSRIRPGHVFAINHSGAGWRMYQIGRVTDILGDVFTCSIRPPLRQAITNGTAIEFDLPRCKMRLRPESAAALYQAVDLLRIGDRVSAGFIESPVT
jgi:hypothetical protein